MTEYREGQIIAMLDAHKLPEGAELEWHVVGATARIVSLPDPPARAGVAVQED